jgi:SAM-dependent methyltransferase
LDHFSRVYARQEYMTPGAAETVALLADAARPDAGSRLLEVAFGKGEAACTLAEWFGCRVVAVERHPPFVEYAADKVRSRGLAGRVALLRADGRRLPVRDGAFDAGYCIGAPSLVGLDECLAELARAVRPGGVVTVSDIVWRRLPDAPLGPEWRWVADFRRISVDEYRAAVEAGGLLVEAVHVHPREAWEVYHAPMLRVAADARAAGDAAFAADVEDGVAVERRAAEAFFDYASFVARRPSGSGGEGSTRD